MRVMKTQSKTQMSNDPFPNSKPTKTLSPSLKLKCLHPKINLQSKMDSNQHQKWKKWVVADEFTRNWPM